MNFYVHSSRGPFNPLVRTYSLSGLAILRNSHRIEVVGRVGRPKRPFPALRTLPSLAVQLLREEDTWPEGLA